MREDPLRRRVNVLVPILREVLKGGPFECFADLTAALKARCGALRIRWTADEINQAYTVVGSNTPLLQPSPPVTWRSPSDEPAPPLRPRATPPPICLDVPPAVAQEILDRFGVSVAGGRIHQPQAVERSADTPEFFDLVEIR